MDVHDDRPVVRTIARAELKPDADRGAEVLAGRLGDLDGRRPDVLTSSLFRWHSAVFVYTEGIGTPVWPEGLFGALPDVLRPWPGGAPGDRLWVPMMDIFHFSRPRNAEHWRRKTPVEAPFARVIRLRPEMVSSYIFYHHQRQEERPGEGDKYGIIAIHENLLFFYQERPRVPEDAPSPPGLATANTPSDWQAVMGPHFAPWDDPGEPLFRTIDHLCSIGLAVGT